MKLLCLFLLTLLSALTAASRVADAAKQLPVVVAVTIDEAVVDGDWSETDTDSVESRVRDFVHEHLRSHYSHWLFSVDDQLPKRRLEFRLAPWLGDGAKLRLIPWIDGRPGEPVAEYLWLNPGDRSIQGFPPPDTAIRDLQSFISNTFLTAENNSGKIAEWLRQNVPIGPEGAWIDPTATGNLMIALPLPMEEFGQLQKSLFRISGRQPGGGAIELEAVGVELPTPYPPNKAPPDMVGLGVLAQTFIVGVARSQIDPALADQVRHVRLGPFYLVEERPPTPFDSADWIDR